MASPYRAEIEAAAARYKLDPNLVEAIVGVESNHQTDAFRFEPTFWARYLAKLPAYAGRNPRRVSSSYGLMQVMYPTAVEHGFAGTPEELFVPETGLEFGCRRLRSLLDWAGGFTHVPPLARLRAAAAAYNGGRGGNAPDAPQLRNGVYAGKVLTAYGKLLGTTLAAPV
jgi:soluble lytic murein transglycosylase-like protein